MTGAATTGDPRSGIYVVAMSNESEDVRCSACGKLLAKLRDGVLAVQRGDLQATFDGQFRASIVCGQPRCRRLNIVRVGSHPAPSRAFTK